MEKMAIHTCMKKRETNKFCWVEWNFILFYFCIIQIGFFLCIHPIEMNETFCSAKVEIKQKHILRHWTKTMHWTSDKSICHQLFARVFILLLYFNQVFPASQNTNTQLHLILYVWQTKYFCSFGLIFSCLKIFSYSASVSIAVRSSK